MRHLILTITTICLMAGGAFAQPFPASAERVDIERAIDNLLTAAIVANDAQERHDAAQTAVDNIAVRKADALEQMRFDNGTLQQIGDNFNENMKDGIDRIKASALTAMADMFAAEDELAVANDQLSAAQRAYVRRQHAEGGKRSELIAMIESAVSSEQATADKRVAIISMQLADTQTALAYASTDFHSVCNDGRAEANPRICDEMEVMDQAGEAAHWYMGLTGSTFNE